MDKEKQGYLEDRKDWAFLNRSTGEIRDIPPYEDMDLPPDYLEKRESEEVKSKIIRKYNGKKRFVKFFVSDRCMELVRRMTKPESWLLFYIEQFISPFDNALRFKGHPNGKLLDTHDLADLLPISYRNARKLIRGLAEKDILREIPLDRQGKAVLINPDICQCGYNQDLHPQIYQEFNTYNTGSNFVKVYNYVGENLSNGEAWLLIRLRFLVSYTDGILRTGGHRNGSILAMKDFPEIIGEGYKNLWTLMHGLKKKNLIAEFDSAELKEKVIAMNPKMALKGYDTSTETAKHFPKMVT